MKKARRAVLERLEQALARDHGAEGCVARRHALRAGDDVGRHPEPVHCEHIADAAKAGDGLVRDHEHVVFVADLAYALEVAGGRREAAARILHRLDEHGSNAVGALKLDGLGDAVGCPQAKGLLVAPVLVGGAIEVRIRHLHATGDERLERDLGIRDAGDRERSLRGAVVGDRPADHLVLRRLAGELEVLLRELPGGLDRLAATGREEDPVQVAGCIAREALGELDRARMRVRPDREEGELLGLPGAGGCKFLAAVPRLHDEQAREPIEVLVAAVIPYVGAFALDDDRDVPAVVVARVAGEVHPEVVARRVGKGVIARLGHVLRCRCHRVPHE